MGAVVIAGVSSETGKTTITLGILRALKNRGLAAQPFKAGPDFIDPMFHRVASGRPSYNLDPILLSENVLKALCARHIAFADVSIVEGVMGLYDGLKTQKDQGSTAHLSKILKAPVILVVDGAGMAASAAALVLGFQHYDPEVNLAGVIVNRLGSESHFQLIKEAIERDTGIPCLGWLPNQETFILKSRHLGLIPVDELPDLEAELDALAVEIENHIDLDQLLKLAENQLLDSEDGTLEQFSSTLPSLAGRTIGVFRDKAFNFYYQDNLELLEGLGAVLIPISPLGDQVLKPCDALYIGGGYPELFKEVLHENQSFIQSLRIALENGLPAYAECGGFMYLTKAIDGVSLVGFFEDEAKMTDKLQRFGYVDLRMNGSIQGKGHEFHFSDVGQTEVLPYTLEVFKPGRPEKVWHCGRLKKMVRAGYPHIHFFSDARMTTAILNGMIGR